MYFKWENENKLLMYTRTWMNFKYMRLNERNWTQKATSSMIPFTQYSWKDRDKGIETRSVSGCQRLRAKE